MYRLLSFFRQSASPSIPPTPIEQAAAAPETRTDNPETKETQTLTAAAASRSNDTAEDDFVDAVEDPGETPTRGSEDASRADVSPEDPLSDALDMRVRKLMEGNVRAIMDDLLGQWIENALPTLFQSYFIDQDVPTNKDMRQVLETEMSRFMKHKGPGLMTSAFQDTVIQTIRSSSVVRNDLFEMERL